MSLPPIVAKVTAETSDLVNGLRTAETRLKTFAKVGGAAAGAVGAAMIALTKASLASVDATTKQARSLGLTHNALKRMSLVANEAGVGTEKLASMMGLMQRNIDGLASGTQAQVDAFKRLNISLSDLQGLQPDQQFARIAQALDQVVDPTEKTALAMDVFGRSGRDAINMLTDYQSKVDDATKFQQRFGIAVDQSAAEGVERANDAVGRLGMIMQGLGNQMATAVAPAIERVANGIAAFVGRVAGFKVELQEFFGTLEVAKASLGEDLFNKIIGKPELIRENADALNAVVQEANQIETIAATAAPQMKILADTLKNINPEATREARVELIGMAQGIERAREELAQGAITQEEFNAVVADGILRAQAIVTEFENINGAQFDTVFGNIKTLADRLMTAARAAALARKDIHAAIFEQSPAGRALSLYGGRGTTSDRPILPTGPAFESTDTDDNDDVTIPSGAAVKDELAARLEALMEGLQTEAEVVAEWYAQSQMTLEEALAKRLITEQEYREQRERLEKEHQDRLAALREMGNKWGVKAAIAGGAEILNAVGQSNQKALKMAKVFSAASALIDTYHGAARELRKGTFGFASAAAVIAKGIGFVNAIKGVSASGGGGGAVGAGGTGAAASGPAGGGVSQNVAIQLVGGDMFNRSQVVTLINKINEAVEGGAKLRIV